MDFRRGDNSKISHFFQQVQHVSDPNEEEHFVGELKRVYDKVSFKDFVEKFIECLKLCLIHAEDTPGIEAVLNFAAHFVASINSAGSTDEDETCPFLKKILEFVCANHGCDNHFVRSRICLFVDKLLCKLGNEVVIDEILYNKLVDSMLERLKDKMPGIRVRAISAVYRLQDPFDANCPVVKALSFHLSMDPSVEARRTILRKLAVAAHTLPTIVERIYDVKDFVRKDAFLVLSKCSMSRFTIKQRQMLLYSGLKDRDERVSKCVEKVLLPLWFDHAKNNFVNMLKSLDVETSTETSFLVLQILFKSSSPQTIIEQVKNHLDEEKLIPLDKLSSENAFFWRCAVHYFHNLDEETMDEDKDELLQSILPELTPLTSYIREYFLKNSEDDKQLEFWEQKQRQFILLQLLQLCNVHDLSDELGRAQLKQLCSDLLLSPQVKKDAVSVIVNVFSRILPDIDEFLSALVEIIMDLKEPFKEDDNTDLSEEEADEEKKENNEIVKISPEVLSKCLTIVVEFLQNKHVTVFNPTLRSLVTTFVCPALEAPDTASRVLALHALSNSCLLDVDLAKQYFLLFCFQVANDDMCLVSLKGIFDLLLFYGLATFKLSDQIDDNEEKKDDEPEKKKRKLKGALVEENSFVSNSGEANTSSNEIVSDLTDQSANLVTMLMSLLDSSSSDIRNVTVEGLCKLIIGGRITSVSLLSKLIILWFSPISEEDYILRQQLGTFFNVYASSFAGSHYMFQQAYLPTIKTLYNAPMDSPLHEIDPDDVAKLLISLMVVRMTKEKGPNPHNSLALGICKEILKTYNANLGNVPVLVRSLLPLQLSFEEPGFIESFKELCQEVLELLENANNKILAKYMQKMMFKIEGAEIDGNLNPSQINNTEQPMDTTNGDANDALNTTGDDADIEEITVDNSKLQNGNVKGSPKRSVANKAIIKSPHHISDKENADSDDADDPDDPDVFDQNDDSDIENSKFLSRKKPATETRRSGSASSTALEQEEYSLSRVNLKRKKELEEKKVQKPQRPGAKEKSPMKKSSDSDEEDSSEEIEESAQTRKSSRKKGADVAPTPSKKSRLQVSKSKKSVRGKENEKVESDSDEADDESDNMSEDFPSDAKKKIKGQPKVDRSLKQSAVKKLDNNEIGSRSSRRTGRRESVNETPMKKARPTPSKSLRSTRKGANKSESDLSDAENPTRGKSKSLRSTADSISAANKATPRKLIEVENIGAKKDLNKRKPDNKATESKMLSEVSDDESSKNLTGRSTRSSRLDLSVPTTPSKNTSKPDLKSSRKVPLKTPNKRNKSPESPNHSESKRRLKDLEILEELSRRSSLHKANIETASNKNTSSKLTPLRKKPSSESDDSASEEESEDSSSKIKTSKASKISKQSASTKTHLRDSDDSTDEERENSPTPVKRSSSKRLSETEKLALETGRNLSSRGRNSRKSLRIALYRCDVSEGRRGSSSLRKSSARRSQSVFTTPEKKKVDARSRSSVEMTPSRRNSLTNKNEGKNTDSLLRQVLTPKVAPRSKDDDSSSSSNVMSRRSNTSQNPAQSKTNSISASPKRDSPANKIPSQGRDINSRKSRATSEVSDDESPSSSPDKNAPRSTRESSRNRDSNPRKSRSTCKVSVNEKNTSRTPSQSPDRRSNSRAVSSQKGSAESNRNLSRGRNTSRGRSRSTNRTPANERKKAQSPTVLDSSSRRSRSTNKTPVEQKNVNTRRTFTKESGKLAKEPPKLTKNTTPDKKSGLVRSGSLRRTVLTPLKSPVRGEVRKTPERNPSSLKKSSSVANRQTLSARKPSPINEGRANETSPKKISIGKKSKLPIRKVDLKKPGASLNKKIVSRVSSSARSRLAVVKKVARQSIVLKKKAPVNVKRQAVVKKVDSRSSVPVKRKSQSSTSTASSSKKQINAGNRTSVKQTVASKQSQSGYKISGGYRRRSRIRKSPTRLSL